MSFVLDSEYKLEGDQPKAVDQLVNGYKEGLKSQVLLGVTGSGKTFTVANVIAKMQMPTLIIAHNKTLAMQLYQEFKEFFPHNHVEYFVSYYDYYQPEAYVPQRDLYIEKESQINEEIDKLRLAATTALMSHTDTIIIASVSCIYNLGSPIEYLRNIIELKVGMKMQSLTFMRRLADIHYDRSDLDFRRGSYRYRGENIDVFLAYQEMGVSVTLFDDHIVGIRTFHHVSGDTIEDLNSFVIFPAKHYLTQKEALTDNLSRIEHDMNKQVADLKAQGKQMEAFRIEQRTLYDLEMIREVGFCSGIENYSRYFDGRKEGDPPYTLIDFFLSSEKGFLTVIDESHISVPQIRGMYNGDRARKQTLVDFGFRLPSAIDNRPLKFDEFLSRMDNLLFTSATPTPWDLEYAEKSRESLYKAKKINLPTIAELLVRPTGLVDPPIEMYPSQGQIPHLCEQIRIEISKGKRVLVTTLTKRMSEALSEYLENEGINVTYLHSDIDTLERGAILNRLRRGEVDVLVGINLLREGLDLPEVGLVAILDADKEGFLRSTTSLIQTMGRAARNLGGRVIMYADKVTNSMQQAMDEVSRRREYQLKYNNEHGIVPTQIEKKIRDNIVNSNINDKIKSKKKPVLDLSGISADDYTPKDRTRMVKELTILMRQAAKELEFEKAASIRDKIIELKA